MRAALEAGLFMYCTWHSSIMNHIWLIGQFIIKFSNQLKPSEREIN